MWKKLEPLVGWVIIVAVVLALVVGWHQFNVIHDRNQIANVSKMTPEQAKAEFVDEACLAPADVRVHDNQPYCNALAARMTPQQKLDLYCGDPLLSGDPQCDPLQAYP